ncbi:MAG: hypothetical protein KAR06_08670 [Deltaproteobacteria bacterium]|nr:hypothetical protein [Deltaproteobacteria bacterium]
MDLNLDQESIDKLTKLDESKKNFESRFYDSEFMGEFGKLENARSERYGLHYSVVVLTVESFQNGSVTPEKEELMKFLKLLITTILTVVRNCDVTGMLENKKVMILLPQTDYFGSLITIKKLTRALEPFTTKGEPYASIIVSQATFPKDAFNFNGAVGIASNRIGSMKDSIWEKLDLKSKLFWEIVAKLTEGGIEGSAYSTFDLGDGADLEYSFINRLNEVIVEEVARSPEKRGVLYIGSRKITEDLPFKNQLNMLGKTGTKIFVVGEGKETNVEFKNATSIPIDDPRVASADFTLYLSEDAAYTLLSKEAWGNSFLCFHSSDPFLTEGLITKFQRDYHLQEQL